MKLNYPTRIKIGIIIIISTVILSNFELLFLNILYRIDKIKLYPEYLKANQYIAFEKTLKSVKKELPSSGQIGYITDNNERAFNKDSRYFLTQYILAPLVVVNSVNYKLVIGNFYSNINPEIYEKHNLIPLKDFGDGVILFKKEAK